jgi:small subunit ribosomal protein S2
MYFDNYNKKTFYNKKTLLTEHFFNYKTLIGNKLSFTNSESYEYIFSINFMGNTLFNIDNSLVLLKRALIFIKNIKENKGNILFIGTRFDLNKVSEMVAKKTKSPFIGQVWSKGLLTNWENSKTSIESYNLLLKKLDMTTKKRLKMENTFSGLTSMSCLPDAVFIFDISTDIEAFQEAKSLNIPVISLVDTNIPIRVVDYPIPFNTESLLSVIFFCSLLEEASTET